MGIHATGAFIKLILGVSILSILFNYVNIYEHSTLGLGFGFLGVFLMIRGGSYFFFAVLWNLFSSYTDHIKASASYKLSLALGVFVIINLTFMVIDNRSSMLGLILIVIFILLQYLITADFRKQASNE